MYYINDLTNLNLFGLDFIEELDLFNVPLKYMFKCISNYIRNRNWKSFNKHTLNQIQ